VPGAARTFEYARADELLLQRGREGSVLSEVLGKLWEADSPALFRTLEWWHSLQLSGLQENFLGKAHGLESMAKPDQAV